MPLDEQVPYGDLLWAARRTVGQHDNAPYEGAPQDCTDCQPDGSCPRLDGARLVVAQHETRAAR